MVGKLKKENAALKISLKKKNDDFQVNDKAFKSVKNTTNKKLKSKDKEIAGLEVENNYLEEELNTLKNKNKNINEEIVAKDNELLLRKK